MQKYQKLIREIAELPLDSGWATPLLERFKKNVRAVLPNTLDWRMESQFRDVLFYQRLAWLQQSEALGVHPDLPLVLDSGPVVLLTAHIQSYRTVVRYLCEAGQRLVLFVSADVFARQASTLYAIVRDLQIADEQPLLLLLDAEKPESLFAAKRACAKGYHLLAYVDGNRGVQQHAAVGEKLLVIRFGETQFRVRQGMLRLAEWLDIPIYTIWSDLDDDFRPYFSVEFIPQDCSVAAQMQAIYDAIYQRIYQNPGQWECFLYLDEWH